MERRKSERVEKTKESIVIKSGVEMRNKKRRLKMKEDREMKGDFEDLKQMGAMEELVLEEKNDRTGGNEGDRKKGLESCREKGGNEVEVIFENKESVHESQHQVSEIKHLKTNTKWKRGGGTEGDHTKEEMSGKEGQFGGKRNSGNRKEISEGESNGTLKSGISGGRETQAGKDDVQRNGRQQNKGRKEGKAGGNTPKRGKKKKTSKKTNKKVFFGF